MERSIIAFLGAGNMARSLIGGLLASNFLAENIRAFDPDPIALKSAQQLGPISTHNNSHSAATDADIIILAVKPQIVREACEDIRHIIADKNPVLISIAAGISTSLMSSYLKENSKIVRCMPNTPALIRYGASGLFANCNVNDKEKLVVESIFSSVGKTFWVELESDIDIVTALSGSGPAYFFLFMEYLIEAACNLGIERQMAISLTKQTALGAAHMVLETTGDVKELRDAVTSPGGTTEQAIKAFKRNGLFDSVDVALKSAHSRAIELTEDLKTN